MMDRSSFANVIITTRLLKHFNVTNVGKFKNFLFAQLDCVRNDQHESAETIFLCKVLTLIHKWMTPQSLAAIENKAIQISESQHIQQDG